MFKKILCVVSISAILLEYIALNILNKIFAGNIPESAESVATGVCLAIGIAIYLLFKNKKSEVFGKLRQQKIEEVSKEFEDGLKEISVDISLPKGEVAYFTIRNIDWYEHRKVTTSISYAGVSQRIKIAKGMSFKAGSITPMRQTENIHQIIESGTLYFTNEKILLIGASGSKNIPLSKILNVINYSNGIEIQRSTGKNVCFQMDFENSLRAKIILDNLIQ